LSHIVISDPQDISSRFGNKQRLGGDGESAFEMDDLENIIERSLAPAPEEDLLNSGSVLDFGAIERHLERIPPREADLIEMYYRDSLKQEQIARYFNITQAAVSYRLHRGIRRIQFLRTIPELDQDEFERELGPKFSDQDREILWLMYETTCQSEIAKRLGLTQGRVRHRFFRALTKIKELIADEARLAEEVVRREQRRGTRSGGEEEIFQEVEEATRTSCYAKYWTVFFAISDKHFNILHEVSLPQFRDRGVAQILSVG
jgi:DNA-directed RNA polymerase specialized sigma24 family protein